MPPACRTQDNGPSRNNVTARTTKSSHSEGPLPTHRTTGLDAVQFAELVLRVQDVTEWNKEKGRPRKLTLAQAIKVTLLCDRQNLTQELVAEFYDVSQPLISTIVDYLEPIITEVLSEFVPDPAEALAGQVAVVDGTLCPCWSWRGHPELFSGKHHTTGHNVQVACDLDAHIRVISEPSPGSWHDVHAYTECGLAELVDETSGIGDKGYVGTNLITPKRKPPGAELNEHDKDFNKFINALRAVVERAIANLKVWRILHTDFRRPLRKFAQAFHAVVALYFFSISF